MITCTNVIKKDRIMQVQYYVILVLLFNWFITDSPSYDIPDSDMDKSLRMKWFQDICEKFVDRYVFDTEDVDKLVKQVHQHRLASLGKYKCRLDGCDKEFVYHSKRVK